MAKTSIIVVRGTDGEVRAFHNICRHRGNKLVWQDFPREETSGTCRQFTCKYHGWRYGLDGALHVRAAGRGVLRPRQGRLRPGAGPLRRVGGLHLRQPRRHAAPVAARVPRPDGHRARRLPVRPDDRALRVPRRGRRQLEDLPRRVPGVLPRARAAPAAGAGGRAQARTRRSSARTSSSTGRTGSPAAAVPAAGRWRRSSCTRSRSRSAAACSGRGRSPTSATSPGVNPGRRRPVGHRQLPDLPEPRDPDLPRAGTSRYRYWPTSHNTHLFEGILYFQPATTVRERVEHEVAAVVFKEFALQDAGTLKGTQQALDSGRAARVPARRPGDPGAALPRDGRPTGSRSTSANGSESAR